MAILQNYATADEIRAVLGVSPEELEDTTLALPIYVRQLQFDLTEVGGGVEAAYLAVAAKSLSSRSITEQKLYDVTAVYSSYVISRLLLTSLGIFAPKQITDGKASQTRTEDPYKYVREGVEASYATLRSRLLAAYAALGNSVGATPNRTYVTTSPLRVNPVTGV